MERFPWILNNELHLGIPVLYTVHYPLVREAAVPVNLTYRRRCFNWVLTQPRSEVNFLVVVVVVVVVVLLLLLLFYNLLVHFLLLTCKPFNFT